MSNEIGGYKFPRKHAKSLYIEEVIKNNAEKGSGNMSEVKRHYIADESLGGIEREFVEVERKAVVGDYVHITSEDGMRDVSTIGRVVADEYDVDDFYADYVSGDKLSEADGGDIYVWVAMGDRYTTLSPTNIIRHHGQRYEMVDRKAEVGEKIIVTERSYSKLGAIRTVSEYDFDGDLRFVEDTSHFASPGSYSVLVPLDDTPQSPQSTDDIIANLVARLAKAERKIADLSEQVGHNTDNIRTWAEDYSEHKAKAKIIDDYQDETIDRVNDLSDKVEMITDDIAMLDERTQPLTTEGVSKLSEELAQVVTEAIDGKLRKGWR